MMRELLGSWVTLQVYTDTMLLNCLGTVERREGAREEGRREVEERKRKKGGKGEEIRKREVREGRGEKWT